MSDTVERVEPMRITDKETNTTYELDFNRDAIRFAEARQFRIEDVSDYPNTKIPELFFYAFRMHHKNMAKNQTDAILNDKLGGLTGAMLERLVLLYEQAALSNTIQTDEDMGKNAKVTVEL